MRIIFMGSPMFALEPLRQLYNANKHYNNIQDNNIQNNATSPTSISQSPQSQPSQSFTKSTTPSKSSTPPDANDSAPSSSNSHTIAAIFTQSPKPVGRKKIIQKTIVHEFANEHKIPVYTPQKLKESIDIIKEIAPDVIVVAAYGLIIPKSILSIPKYGCINIHASILPMHKGAAPMFHSIANRDSETGITIMQMDAGIDTGDMIAIEKMPLNDEISITQLELELSKLGAKAICNALENIDNLNKVKQPENNYPYACKITREMEKIDWGKDAHQINALLRALTNGAYTSIDGFGVKIFSAQIVDTTKEMINNIEDVKNRSDIKKIEDVTDNVNNKTIDKNNYTDTNLLKNSHSGLILSEKLVLCAEETALMPILIQPEGGRKMLFSDFLKGRKHLIGKYFA